MTDTITIQFVRRYSIWQPGMVAGFAKEQAKEHVDAGRANYWKEPTVAAATLPQKSSFKVRGIRKSQQ